MCFGRCGQSANQPASPLQGTFIRPQEWNKRLAMQIVPLKMLPGKENKKKEQNTNKNSTHKTEKGNQFTHPFDLIFQCGAYLSIVIPHISICACTTTQQHTTNYFSSVCPLCNITNWNCALCLGLVSAQTIISPESFFFSVFCIYLRLLSGRFVDSPVRVESAYTYYTYRLAGFHCLKPFLAFLENQRRDQ